MRTFPIALLLLALGALPAAEDGTAAAQAIVAAVGRPIGMALLPRCGSDGLALALAAAAPTAYVIAQVGDETAARRGREAADDAGLLNRRVAIDVGGLERLGPAARSCDLVVLTDLRAAELTPALAAELARVLHPWYGIAVLGGSGIATKDLESWAGAIGKATIDAKLPGLVVVHAGALEGTDDWTHWWHGPDNNPVSADRAYTMPESIQWAGRPFFGSRIDLPIVAGGRCFFLGNGGRREGDGTPYVLDGAASGKPLLLAMASGSGAILWSRSMDAVMWEQGARSVMVAVDGRLLVAEGEAVLALDQVTGAELARLEPKCGQIHWLAVVDGRVLVLGGPSEPVGNIYEVRQTQVAPFHVTGLALATFALKDFSPGWRVDRPAGADAFDPTSLAVAGGRLFATTVGGVVEARALSDGAVAWTAGQTVSRNPKQGAYEWDYLSRHPISGFAVAGLYVSDGVGLNNLTAYDQGDGSVRWHRGASAYGNGNGLMYFADQILVTDRRFDPVTGADRGSLGGLAHGGCSRLTASPIGIFGAEGFCWDSERARAIDRSISAKSSCAAGTYVADGLSWKFPSPCPACSEWRGFLVRGAREPASPPLPRLVVCGDQPAKPTIETPPGWTTYRGDARRSAASPATVPAAATVAWTIPSAHPRAPKGGRQIDAEMAAAPPVVAGDTALIADADGSLTALALADGRRRWRSFAGGRIWSSPTVWRDRVLVGALDGTVSAFALADGRELWRLRVAPGSSRIPVYNQPGSRWPVLGSPLVVDDRGFAVAGLLDAVDGVVAISFDPASGKLLWERSDWKPAGVAREISGAGQLCWDGAAVVYHGGESPLVRLDPATGDCLPVYGKFDGLMQAARMLKGQDVGALPDGTLVSGGRRLLTEQGEDGAQRSRTTYLVPGDDHLVRLPMLSQEDGPPTWLPSWDDHDVVSYELVAKSRRVACASLADLQSALTAGFGLPKVPMPNGPSRPFEAPKPAWSHESHYFRGMALASNAVVAIEGNDGLHWNVAAYARADGKRLWLVKLAVAPVNGGLAISADGTVVVALLDGSVMAIGPAAAAH
jgi:outer membrane protein assembly factor BamB